MQNRKTKATQVHSTTGPVEYEVFQSNQIDTPTITLPPYGQEKIAERNRNSDRVVKQKSETPAEFFLE